MSEKTNSDVERALSTFGDTKSFKYRSFGSPALRPAARTIMATPSIADSETADQAAAGTANADDARGPAAPPASRIRLQQTGGSREGQPAEYAAKLFPLLGAAMPEAADVMVGREADDAIWAGRPRAASHPDEAEPEPVPLYQPTPVPAYTPPPTYSRPPEPMQSTPHGLSAAPAPVTAYQPPPPPVNPVPQPPQMMQPQATPPSPPPQWAPAPIPSRPFETAGPQRLGGTLPPSLATAPPPAPPLPRHGPPEFTTLGAHFTRREAEPVVRTRSTDADAAAITPAPVLRATGRLEPRSDRRSVSEMFRVLSGRAERAAAPAAIARPREEEGGLFRRI